MKKAFTLIELLAVIIILAIIALIATPTVLSVVNKAKNKADMESANAIVDTARLYKAEAMLDSVKQIKVDNIDDIYSDVSINNKPEVGKLYVNNKGLVAMAVVINNKCYYKEFSSNIEVRDISNCDLGYIGNDTILPTISQEVIIGSINENNWYKEDVYINTNVIDNESGVSGYKRCISQTECNPDDTIYTNNTIILSTESANNYVCVIGVDKQGNESNKDCKIYKIDKTNPTLTAISDNVSISQGESHQVSSYFNEPVYGVSGGSLSCSPIDTITLELGTQTVSCTATSNSGLSTTTTRDIIIIKPYNVLTYGGSSSDYGRLIVQTLDGGYIVVGYTQSSDGDITDGNNGGYDILIMKFNSDGSKAWDKTYGGSGDDRAYSIIQTSDGSYILTGYTASSDGDITDGNNGLFDILVMKINSDGSKVWDKTYGGSSSEIAYSIIQATDSGYILTGYTKSNDYDITDGNNGGNDILVIKLNSDGSKAWDKTYGGSGSEYGYSMIQTSDGRYILTGYTQSSNYDITDGNNGLFDILVMKLNSDGSKVWDKTYGGSGSEYGYSIIQTSDSGYILTGYTASSDYDITDGNNGGSDVLVMKLNSDGSKAWDKTYGGSGDEIGYSIIQTSDSGYILTGYTASSDYDITDGNNGGSDVLVMKLNSDGSKAWDKTYGGSDEEEAFSIIQTNDSDYILTGYTKSNDYDITDNNWSISVLNIKIDKNNQF